MYSGQPGSWDKVFGENYMLKWWILGLEVNNTFILRPAFSSYALDGGE